MNKKVYLPVLMFLGFSLFANAQINKGSVLLGGQIFNNTTVSKTNGQKDQQSTAAVYNISVGKAIKENAVVGINLNYSPITSRYYSVNPNGNIGKTKTRNYSAGVYYRLYKNIGKDFYFFGEFGAAYIGAKSTNYDLGGDEINSSSMSGGRLGLTPGLSYKLFNKFHLEIMIPDLVSIQYALTKPETSLNSAKQEQFLFNSSLNSNALNALGVGFRIIL